MNTPDRAKELFFGGMNCAQAVVCSFADRLGIDEKTAMKFSEGLGGGMSRLRLTCGAVSAMAMVAGLKLSRGEPGDVKTRGEVYSAVREMTSLFKEKNGSLICRELLGTALPKDNGPIPEARTAEYYKKRPCAEYIRDCAEIIEKTLF